MWFLRNARTYLVMAAVALLTSIAAQVVTYLDELSVLYGQMAAGGIIALGFGYYGLVLGVFRLVIVWVPTLVMLALLGVAGRRVSAAVFRWSALVLLPLPALWAGWELSGWEATLQLLIELPVPVVFAFMVRPPASSSGAAGRDGQAVAGESGPEVGSPGGSLQPAMIPSGRVRGGPVRRPSTHWCAAVVWALIWIGSMTWSADWFVPAATPAAERRAAVPMSAPEEEIPVFAHAGHVYVVYRAAATEPGHGAACHLTDSWPLAGSGPARLHTGLRMFAHPAGTVRHDGVDYAFVGQVSGGDGELVKVACEGPTLLVEADPPTSPPPWFALVLASWLTPLAAAGAIALARHRSGRVAPREPVEPVEPVESVESVESVEPVVEVSATASSGSAGGDV